MAYISNNSFLDGVTHRQMRKHLLESFDTIYILDLHGNAKKQEVCPDGSPDQNVFDIMQGVSINIFVKTSGKQKGELGQVFHADLQGKKMEKYNFLVKNTLQSVSWKSINTDEKYAFFVPKDFSQENTYTQGFKIDTLFQKFSSGIESQNDNIAIQFSEKEMIQVIDDFLTLDKFQLAYQL